MSSKNVKDLTALAFNIKRLRLERGWSRHDLAERYGCDYSYIAQLENDLTPLGHKGRMKLSELFDVDETELFRPKNAPDIKMAPVILYKDVKMFFEDHAKKKYAELIKEYRAAPVESEDPIWVEICETCIIAEPYAIGDALLIDRTIPVDSGDMVIGFLGDQTFLGRYHEAENSGYIMPLKEGLSPIMLSPAQLANQSFRMAPVLGHFRPLKKQRFRKTSEGGAERLL